ncbi:hypothetical protein N7468_004859 [Penicillium chermesinum]|uniref:Uncharacterized protein n=1 Tax=Penicillium chermesinum TaxID=63820 RepID=A0A9W9P9I8_9EURO|nr:uncharacterized protein N7468_004859 [Penicillium chermesinum]KAJ5240240.1 hypothetical protein N7468_004859 [Penicillium chermesinum]
MAWKPMALAFLLASPALADVYFGTLSGDDLNSGTCTCVKRDIDPSDDCGATWTAAGDTTPSPPAGTFYANVIDTADKNAIVGRCVYEESDAHYCSDVIDTLLWEAGVHCYMEPGVGC